MVSFSEPGQCRPQDDHGREKHVKPGSVGLPDPRLPELGDALQVPAAGLLEDQFRLEAPDQKPGRNRQPCPAAVRLQCERLREQNSALNQQHDCAGEPDHGGDKFEVVSRHSGDAIVATRRTVSMSRFLIVVTSTDCGQERIE